jgi:6-pyruvoyltetrahydropterin/6-carboxytetrahydropterin synthase
MFKVERYHDISVGHRVYGHESKCRHLHGHNYRIHFNVVPEQFWAADAMRGADRLDNVGRVIDFSVIKTTLCEWLEENWDHKTLLWDKDPLCQVLMTLSDGAARQSIVPVSFNPTAENIARYLVETVGPALLEGYEVTLVSVRVDETRKCSATYERER